MTINYKDWASSLMIGSDITSEEAAKGDLLPRNVINKLLYMQADAAVTMLTMQLPDNLSMAEASQKFATEQAYYRARLDLIRELLVTHDARTAELAAK